MRLEIRPLQLSDIGQLGRLLRLFADEMGRDSYPIMDDEEIEAQLIYIVETVANPMCMYLVAFDGKKLIGWFFGEYIVRRFGKPRVSGVAREMFVVQGKRNKGIGSKFLRLAVQTSLQNNVGSVENIGIPGKTQARWEKLGFTSYMTHGFMDVAKAKALIKETTRESLPRDNHQHKNRDNATGNVR